MLAGILSIRQEYSIFNYEQAEFEYIELFCLYYKLVMINLFCYLWGNAFSDKTDSYKYLVTGFAQKRIKYLSSKIIFLIVLTKVLVFINLFIVTLLGILCGKMYLNHQIIIELLIKLVFISVIYGLLSAIFSMFINSNLVYFISSGLFVFGELALILLYKYMNTENLKSRILMLFFMMICAGGYIFILYPAYQIPMFYVFLFLAIYVIIDNRKNCKITKKDIISIVVMLLDNPKVIKFKKYKII